MKVFYGEPGTPGIVRVRQDDGGTRPLRHDVRHSPTGFSWGYGGSGPSDLARNLLLEAGVNPEEVEKLYHVFKFEVVAKWPIDEPWSISDMEIRTWVERKET